MSFASVTRLQATGKINRNINAAEKQIAQQSECHKQQCRTENRIQTADQTVDRQKCGKCVIGKDYTYPERSISPAGSHAGKQVGWCDNENGTDKNQQPYRNHTHKLPDSRTQLTSDKLGQRIASTANRHHSRHEVMDCPGKDSTEYDPQKCRRTEHHTHYRTEYGAKSRYIQKLDEKYAPCGHRNIIHPVALGPAWHQA